MDKALADALLDFYQKILKPEFDFIKEKLVEHDQRFTEMDIARLKCSSSI